VDYRRSNRALIELIAEHVPAKACIRAPGLSPAMVASLEYFGHWQVDARRGATGNGCDTLLLMVRQTAAPAAASAPPGWQAVATVRRPAERDEATLIFRRTDSMR
jgi:hypothetical protein